MKTSHKSDKAMRAYLLGLLPDREAAAMEQRYFTEDARFHEIEEEENALIEDYLDDKLPPDERELFASRYFEVPELQRKMNEIRSQRIANFQPARRTNWIAWRIAAALALVLVVVFALVTYHQWRMQKSRLPAQAETPKQQSFPSAIPPVPQKNAETLPPSETHSVLHAEGKRTQRFAKTAVPNKMSESPEHANILRPPDTMEKPILIEALVRSFAGNPSKLSTRKMRIAVLDFDYGTVQSYVNAIYGSNQDVGKGITDMLVEKLVNGGKYVVVERKALDKILQQQEFSGADRANPAIAPKLGHLLGVDAVIIGSITKFGRDDHSKSIGGVGFGRAGFGIGGIKKNESKAVCAISALLVDTTTGEILAAVTGEGESKRSGTSLIGAGVGTGGGGGGFDSHASNFGQTLLGEAVTQAVSDVGAKLNSASDIPTKKIDVSGVVADVSANTLIINVGSKTGLKVGDRLEITRIVSEIKDPTTGEVLKMITVKIGDAIVKEVDVDSAALSFSGSEPAKVGDVAKTPQQ